MRYNLENVDLPFSFPHLLFGARARWFSVFAFHGRAASGLLLEFVASAKKERNNTYARKKRYVENFALLVARVREDQKLVNALARFARQIHDSRQCWFRQLSSEAFKQRFAHMLETRFHI